MDLLSKIKTWHADPKSSWNTNPNLFAKEIYECKKLDLYSDDEYKLIFDEFQKNRSDYMAGCSCLRQRLDNRSLGDLALQFYKNEAVEDMITANWINSFASRHFKSATPLSAEYCGVSSLGYLIFKPELTKLDVKKADILLLPINIYLEYKTCSCTYKATYKVADIENYIKQNFNVLTVFFSDKPTWDNAAFYTLMSRKNLEDMLSESVRFEAREMGYKECIQFHISSVGKFGLSPAELEEKVRRNSLREFSLKLQDFCKVHLINK